AWCRGRCPDNRESRPSTRSPAAVTPRETILAALCALQSSGGPAMLSRPRNALLCALAVALAGGYFVTGHFMYVAPIGLDATAFPLGEWIQGFFPGTQHAVAGLVWTLVSLLVIMALAVWLVKRAIAGRVDPVRRSFLVRAGSGAGMALGSLLVAGGAGAA